MGGASVCPSLHSACLAHLVHLSQRLDWSVELIRVSWADALLIASVFLAASAEKKLKHPSRASAQSPVQAGFVRQ